MQETRTLPKQLSFNEAVGATVSMYLHLHDMTRADLGRIIGITGQNVSFRLHGKTKWTAEELTMIALFLGLDVNSLTPSSDGMGGWVPAQFAPHAVPAHSSARSRDLVPQVGLEPTTDGL